MLGSRWVLVLGHKEGHAGGWPYETLCWPRGDGGAE